MNLKFSSVNYVFSFSGLKCGIRAVTDKDRSVNIKAAETSWASGKNSGKQCSEALCARLAI